MKIVALASVPRLPAALPATAPATSPAGAGRKAEAVPPAAAEAVGVSKQVPIGKVDGAPNTAFRVFTIAPGGHTPYHAHAWEHSNYIIAGTGELVDADGKARRVTVGDFVLVLPHEKHQYRNASPSVPFVMICAVPLAYE